MIKFLSIEIKILFRINHNYNQQILSSFMYEHIRLFKR